MGIGGERSPIRVEDAAFLMRCSPAPCSDGSPHHSLELAMPRWLAGAGRVCLRSGPPPPSNHVRCEPGLGPCRTRSGSVLDVLLAFFCSTPCQLGSVDSLLSPFGKH
ncbi:hypothetical protein B0H67DRAFT_30459 [Lasiosphaeris hirsuta]|uniref:Uncharacterized protein n=1 Tax=Lasiosphaeris hirsuta TaxID=260670 RepID=A0AA40BA39_9PEZI|nr:hypothetical protein B0H67DRAFT_30459 [Lasiosphaeris hirsuta]